MARHPRPKVEVDTCAAQVPPNSAATPPSPAGRPGDASAVPSGLRIEEVLFQGARRFYAVGPDHAVWKDPGHVLRHVPNLERCFVRLEPPPTASAEEVAAVRRVLTEVSGAVVRYVPPRAAAALPEPAPPTEAPRRARDVVLELAADVPSRDVRALLEYCAGICDEVGL